MNWTVVLNGNTYVLPGALNANGTDNYAYANVLPQLLYDLGAQIVIWMTAIAASVTAAANSSNTAAGYAAAAAASAASTVASSTSNVVIGAGIKAFTIGTNSQFVTNQWVMASASPTQYLVGQVVSYAGGVLTITIPTVGVFGSGTFSSWMISASGPVGPIGATGVGAGFVYQVIGFTASNLAQYLCDTSGGAFTVALPASPTLGNNVRLQDAAGTWKTNNLTVNLNGYPLLTANGVTASSTLICNMNGADLVLWFDGSKWRL